jgi:formylglycine-generating enzyme required for sulfatase activity
VEALELRAGVHEKLGNGELASRDRNLIERAKREQPTLGTHSFSLAPRNNEQAKKVEALPTTAVIAPAQGSADAPVPPLAPDQGKRIALVVGNSNYQKIGKLDNPANDAKLMASALKAIGFQLVGDGPQLDLDKLSFDRVVRDFGDRLQGAEVALFYYAGHAVEVRGENYLAPVTANPAREADVDFELLDAKLVVRQMEAAGTRLNLIMLDACRNNPLAGRAFRATGGGLAQMQAPEGTLISFATQPGNVALDGLGDNSPYTKALAETVRSRGLDLFDALNQVGLKVKRATGGAQQPWYSSSPIEGEFYFAGPAITAPVPANSVTAEAEGGETQVVVVAPPPLAPKPVETAVFAVPKPRPQKPGETFQDCEMCPEMVVISAGQFRMGSPVEDKSRIGIEWPQREVAISAFAVSKFEVTREQFENFLKNSSYRIDDVTVDCDSYRLRSRDHRVLKLRAIVCVSWNDARAYVEWLSTKTKKTYRLLSEAEWEYVARGGTTSAYYSGDIEKGIETEVAASGANHFGVHNMFGSAFEWVEDCSNLPGEATIKLNDLPSDGSAWKSGYCGARMIRGGSVLSPAFQLRSAYRLPNSTFFRSSDLGFRVATDLR